MATRRKPNAEPEEDHATWNDVPLDVLGHMGPYLGPGQRASVGQTQRRTRDLYNEKPNRSVLPGIGAAQAALSTVDDARWIKCNLANFMDTHTLASTSPVHEKLPGAFKIVRDCVLTRETFVIRTQSEYAIECLLHRNHVYVFRGVLVYARGAFKMARAGQYERYTPDALPRWFTITKGRRVDDSDAYIVDVASLDGEFAPVTGYRFRVGDTVVHRYGETTSIYSLQPGRALQVSGAPARSGPSGINPIRDLEWLPFVPSTDESIRDKFLQVVSEGEDKDGSRAGAGRPWTDWKVLQITTDAHAVLVTSDFRGGGHWARVQRTIKWGEKGVGAIIFGVRLGYEGVKGGPYADQVTECDRLTGGNDEGWAVVTAEGQFECSLDFADPIHLDYPGRLSDLGAGPWDLSQLTEHLQDDSRGFEVDLSRDKVRRGGWNWSVQRLLLAAGVRKATDEDDDKPE